MKVIVLHGDYIVKAYERLQKFIAEAQKRNWEIINDEIAITPSLFGKERLIIYRRDALLSKADIKNLSRLEGTIIVYHEGKIPITFLRGLPKETKIEEFNLPKIIWNFLDRPSVKLLHEVVKNEPIEFVFSLLARRFRDLYWVKTDPKTLFYPTWRLAKLDKQVAKYTTREVARIINELAEIDIKAKTSKADLLSSLDLLFLTKLE